jgi:hypothetical protein
VLLSTKRVVVVVVVVVVGPDTPNCTDRQFK